MIECLWAIASSECSWMAYIFFLGGILKMFGFVWHWPNWTGHCSLEEWVGVCMSFWTDVLTEWDTLYYWPSGGNSVIVALMSWWATPSDCILTVSTPMSGSLIMMLWYSTMVEIDSISCNCSSGRDSLLAVLIRGGDSGPPGFTSNLGVASHPCFQWSGSGCTLTCGGCTHHPWFFSCLACWRLVFLLWLRHWLQHCHWHASQLWFWVPDPTPATPEDLSAWSLPDHTSSPTSLSHTGPSLLRKG